MIESIHYIIGGGHRLRTLSFRFPVRHPSASTAQRQHNVQRIRSLQRKIDAALQDDCTPESRESFSTTLKTARLTTGLQLPRLRNQAKLHQAPPEKYTILRRMASQGMDAEEIALSLASHAPRRTNCSASIPWPNATGEQLLRDNSRISTLRKTPDVPRRKVPESSNQITQMTTEKHGLGKIQRSQRCSGQRTGHEQYRRQSGERQHHGIQERPHQFRRHFARSQTDR
jgi:hypothetical protein